MKIFLGLVIFFILFSFVKAQERVIDWHPQTVPGIFTVGENGRYIPSDITALELVQIKIEDKPISLGQSFPANKGWLKSLTVRVKNVSGKAISSIRIHFVLPEAKAENGIYGFSLEYGKELSTGIDYGPQKDILPGEELDLTRNQRHYDRDTTGITKRTGITDFSRLLIGPTVVRFEDGTVWSSAKLPIHFADPKSQD